MSQLPFICWKICTSGYNLLRLNSKSPLSLWVSVSMSPFPTGTKTHGKTELSLTSKILLSSYETNTVKGITLHKVTCARKSSTAHEISTLSPIYSPASNCRMRTSLCHSWQCFDIFAPSLLCPPTFMLSSVICLREGMGSQNQREKTRVLLPSSLETLTLEGKWKRLTA